MAGARVPVVELLLEVELTVSTVDVAIEDGRVADVTAGSTTGTAKLSASGRVIAEVEDRPVTLRAGSGPGVAVEDEPA